MKTRRNYNNSRRRRKTRKRVMRGGRPVPPYDDALTLYNKQDYVKAFNKAYDNHQTLIDCEILYQLFLFDYKPEIKKLFLNQMKNEDKVKFKEVKNKLTTDDLIYEFFIINQMISFITTDKSLSIPEIKQAQFTVLCEKFLGKIMNLTTTLAFKCLLRAFVYSKLGYYYKTKEEDRLTANKNYTLARAEYEIYDGAKSNPDTQTNIINYGIDKEDIKTLAKILIEQEVDPDPFYEGENFEPTIVKKEDADPIKVEKPVPVPEIVNEAPPTAREIRILEMKKARMAKKVNEESLVLDTLDSLTTFLDTQDPNADPAAVNKQEEEGFLEEDEEDDDEVNIKKKEFLALKGDEGGRGRRRTRRRRHEKIRRTRRKLF